MALPHPVRPVAPPASLASDRRAVLGEGVAYSAMVGLGETYLPAFVLAIGLGDATAGLVATLPMLAGAVVQMLAPWGSRILGSYRRWVVTCAVGQALTFVPLVVGALQGDIATGWVYASAALYWSFGLGVSPAWNAWMGYVIPPGERPRFFARRARWTQATLAASIVAAGLFLERAATGTGRVFAVLFLLAAAARIVSALLASRQSEPEGVARHQHDVTPFALAGHLRQAPAGAWLLFLVAMQAAVFVSAPFFTPFLLGPARLTYGDFTLVLAAAFLARILVLPALGRVAHGPGGTRALLRWGVWGVAPLPALWLVSDHLAWFLALQVLGGVAWAAMELATLLAFFQGAREEERSGVLALYNLASTVALALGALAGSWLLAHGGGYVTLFLVSAVARGTLCLAIRRVPHLPHADVIPVVRTIAVRPASGTLQRPVLPTLDDAGETEEIEPPPPTPPVAAAA